MNIARNVIWNWLALLVIVSTSFCISPFLVSRLGKADYGLWTLIISTIGYLGLVDFGMRTAVVKYVSQYHAVNDTQMLNKVLNSSFYLFFFLILGILCLGIVLAFFFPYFFSLPAERWWEVRLILVIATVMFAIQFFGTLVQGIFWGIHRFDIENGTRIVTVLLNACLIVLVLSQSSKLLYLALISTSTAILYVLVTSIALLKLMKFFRFAKEFFCKTIIQNLINYGLYNFVISLSLRSIANTDLLVIGVFLPMAEVTHYGLGKMMVVYAEQVLASIASAILPHASALDAQKKDLRIFLLQTLKINFAIGSVMYIGFITLGSPFMQLWMGPEFEVSSQVLTYLAIGSWSAVMVYPMDAVLKGIGNLKFLAKVKIAEAFLNLLIGLLLISKYEIFGIAIGVASAAFIVNFCFIPMYVWKKFGFTFKDFCGLVIPPYLCSIPCFLLYAIVPKHLYSTSWLTFIPACIAVALVYECTSLWVCFSKDERKQLYHRVRKIFPSSNE